jgi:hypothetical protein
MRRRALGLVAGALVASVAAAQQAAQPVTYVPFRNTQFKFATEIPAHWESERPTPSALVLSGPKGGDEYYTTINFQVVQRRAQGEDGLDFRARELQRQWATAPKYQLVSQEQGQLGGAPAVRMLAQYQIPGGTDLYRQEQFVCEKGAYFYLISYTAPVDLYPKHYAKMERAIKAFQFLP